MGYVFFFFFQAEDGIRDGRVTGVQTCALPICSAECGEEVVKGNFVGHVDGCEAQAPPVIVFGAEQVVISDAGVKQITWSDSRWIVVVVGRSCRGDSYPRRAVLGSGATRESGSQCGRNAIAS